MNGTLLGLVALIVGFAFGFAVTKMRPRFGPRPAELEGWKYRSEVVVYANPTRFSQWSKPVWAETVTVHAAGSVGAVGGSGEASSSIVSGEGSTSPQDDRAGYVVVVSEAGKDPRTP